ncbi:hypothetical protein ACQ4PT_055398 [Festuca glaucescens]
MTTRWVPPVAAAAVSSTRFHAPAARPPQSHPTPRSKRQVYVEVEVAQQVADTGQPLPWPDVQLPTCTSLRRRPGPAAETERGNLINHQLDPPASRSARRVQLNPHTIVSPTVQRPPLSLIAVYLFLSPRRAAMNNLLTDSFELPRRDSSRDGDVEMGMHQPDASDNLKGFLKKVDGIESLIAKLMNLLTKLQTANEESKAVTKASAMKAIKQRMEKDIDEVGKIARLAKAKFDELEKDNLSNRQKPGCGKGSAVDRSREQTTGAVKKKLKGRMDEFQVLRESIRQEYREVVERRVFTVTGNRPDEETIDDLIETGRSEQIFKDAVQQQGRGQILDTVAEIQERHDAVRDLERKLLELQQIFLDMAVLVDAQGDMINHIETHVSNATNHISQGVGALQNAKKLQRNSRKWMCYAIILLLVVVVIVVVAVIQPWKK